MRAILHPMLMILIAVFLTGSLAIPHICMDKHAAPAKVEQQVKAEKMASNDHQNSSSKAGDNCCMAHHCCFAKLVNPVQSIWKAVFVSKTIVLFSSQNQLASFDPKGLDRPPKFFA